MQHIMRYEEQTVPGVGAEVEQGFTGLKCNPLGKMDNQERDRNAQPAATIRNGSGDTLSLL